MSRYLRSYFTDSTSQKVFIDAEDPLYGALTIYLPQKGKITVISDNYSEKTMANDFFQYYFTVFDKPDITFLKTNHIVNIDNTYIMSHQYTSSAAMLAKNLGICMNHFINTFSIY